MNRDNERLREIQQFKTAYTNLKKDLEKAESISECLEIQAKIDELEVEENEILKNCDVII